MVHRFRPGCGSATSTWACLLTAISCSFGGASDELHLAVSIRILVVDVSYCLLDVDELVAYVRLDALLVLGVSGFYTQ